MPPQTRNTTVITLQPLTGPAAREPLQPDIPRLLTAQPPREPLQLGIALGGPQIPQPAHPAIDMDAALPRQGLRARHGAPEVPTGRLRRDDVDEGVPEALQGQDERFGVVEAEVVLVRVGEGVEPVDARGHPGDEQRAEEEERHPRVQPGFRVGFAERGVAGEAAHAEEVRRREFALVLLILADFHVDAVRVEATRFGGFGAGDCHFGVVVVFVVVAVLWVVGGVAAGVGCDVDFGGDGAFERIFVEGVEEASELMAIVPDFAKSHQIDDPGEEECDPS